jgi:ATP adenylyltransferase
MKRLFISLILLANSNLIALHNDISDTEVQLEGYDTPILYAPWRDTYLKESAQSAPKDASCPFCREMKYSGNVDNFILRKFKHCLVMLNLFPYVKGHLLVMPLEHKGLLRDLSPATRAEMMEIANASLEILDKMYSFDGANIGFNIGRISGASIPGHLHMHIIPRTNVPLGFVQIIGRTEVINFDMATVYAELKPEFDKIVLP